MKREFLDAISAPIAKMGPHEKVRPIFLRSGHRMAFSKNSVHSDPKPPPLRKESYFLLEICHFRCETILLQRSLD